MVKRTRRSRAANNEEASGQMMHAANNNFQNAPAPKGVLARLFRDLWIELGAGAFGWSQLMQQYLNNPANGVKNTAKDRATARGNLNKELFREKLSWNVFMKAIRFFDPVKATFTVKLEFRTGKTIESSVAIVERQPKRKVVVDPTVLPEDQRGLEKSDFDAR